MEFTASLIAGLAQHLADAGIGLWQPTVPYAPGDTAIVVAVLPAAPDRCVCLTPYPVEDWVGVADVTVGVQVRCRGGQDPTGAQDLDDRVFDLIHGADGHSWGGVDVVQVYRQSGAPIGRDKNDRYQVTSNDYIDADRPTASRPY